MEKAIVTRYITTYTGQQLLIIIYKPGRVSQNTHTRANLEWFVYWIDPTGNRTLVQKFTSLMRQSSYIQLLQLSPTLKRLYDFSKRNFCHDNIEWTAKMRTVMVHLGMFYYL